MLTNDHWNRTNINIIQFFEKSELLENWVLDLDECWSITNQKCMDMADWTSKISKIIEKPERQWRKSIRRIALL